MHNSYLIMKGGNKIILNKSSTSAMSRNVCSSVISNLVFQRLHLNQQTCSFPIQPGSVISQTH